jgi:hypothetical protein
MDNSMSKHLTDEQIAHGLKGLHSAEEWIAADEHISQCPECRERLAKAWDLTVALQPQAALPKESKQPDEHLTFEQLESYADGKMSVADQESAQAHAKVCGACAEELRDLEAFKKKLANSAAQATTGLQPWQVAPVVRWPVLLRVAAVIVVATVAAVAFLWVKEKHPGSASVALNNPAANNGSPPAQKPNALAVEIASLHPDDQRAVHQAMEQGKFTPPQVLAELRGSKEKLMGESPLRNQFRVLEPVGEVVISPRPIFRWQPLKGTQSYSVVVFDTKLNPVESSPDLHESSWSTSRALKQGRVYEWQVTAKTADGNSVIAPAPPSPEAKFLVLEKTKADEIEQFQQSHPADHLVLGILYADRGVFPAAANELKQISPGDPNYNLAQKLLTSVEELRSHP